MENYYLTIEKPCHTEYNERNSQFLVYAFPIESFNDFKNKRKELKEIHPKASHICYAYRLGTDGLHFKTGDDGEPQGSAGKPILKEIDRRQLTDLTVLVVRYFGGTLLGMDGLIYAYKTATSLVLQLTPVIKKPILELFNIEYDYTVTHEVMLITKRFNCVIIENKTELFCRMIIGIPKESINELVRKFEQINGVVIQREKR